MLSTRSKEMFFESPKAHAITKIEGELLSQARKYFEQKNFSEVTVPHITRATGACENVGTMFDVNFFGEKSYLIQTGQLYLESLIPYMGNMYCIGSSFRAEPAVDERHLTEFTLVEMELPCNLDELISHIEGIISSMVNGVLKNRSKELEILGTDKSHIEILKGISSPFNKITYDKAVDILSDFGVSWGDDLKNNHEKFLVEHFGGKPLFITHFPEAIKFFNMKQNDKNPKIVNSTDCILPYSGEAVGAAEREFEYDSLYRRLSDSKMLQQLVQKGGSIDDFGWYLNHIKSKGMIPHAGCGIGLNRITQFILGTDDIRKTTPFPQNRESLI